MALNIDLAPTMLSLAGVKAPPSMQGRDLMPLVRGERRAWRREWFYSHYFEHPRIPKNEGVRTENWAYMRYLASGYEELYDLKRDGAQEHNLASTDKPRLEAMRRRRDAWEKALAAWNIDAPWREPAASA